jgi:ankyrin repeat protein
MKKVILTIIVILFSAFIFMISKGENSEDQSTFETRSKPSSTFHTDDVHNEKKQALHKNSDTKVTREELPQNNELDEKSKPLALEKRDEMGNTPLMQILDSENYQLAFDYLKKGANPVVKNNEGLSATGLAAMTGDFKLFKEFVKLTGEVNPKLHANKTALSLAALEGNIEMVKYILSHENIEVDHRDNLGQSYLYLATLGENKEIVNILLNKGADPDLQNNEGESARDLAMKSSNDDFVTIFKTKTRNTK